jgi:predicted ribosome-associated RNA-binding protein Tma20
MCESAMLVDEVDKALRNDYSKALGEELGSQHWTALKQTLARPPGCTTARINCNGLSKADIQAIVQVPFRFHDTIADTILFPVLQHDVQPVDKTVVVGAMCGMAVLRGSQVYKPGIKAISSGVCCGDLVSLNSGSCHNANLT